MNMFDNFKKIEDFFHKGEFVKALHEIDQLEHRAGLREEERISGSILKSQILLSMEKYERGLDLAEQAIQGSKQIDNLLLMIDAYISKASALCELARLDESIEELEKGEKLLTTGDLLSQFEIVKRRTLLNLIKGKIFRKKGNPDLALDYLRECLSSKQELGNSFEIADALNAIGIIHASKGELDLALTYLNQSLEIFEELGNQYFISKVLINFGMIYWIKRELDQALDYYNKSLELNERLENKRLIAIISTNISLIYMNRGELNSSLSYCKKGLLLFEELEDKINLVKGYVNIGLIHQIKGDLDIAIQFFEKAVEIGEELNDKNVIANSLNNIGYCLSLQSEEGFKKALIYFKKSLEVFIEIGNVIDLNLPLFNMIEVSVKLGLIKEAQMYLRKLEEIHDKEKNKLIDQKYRMSKGLVLNTSDRLIKKGEAQQIFQQISQEEVIDIEITVMAMLYLCESLIIELKASGSDEILQELKGLLLQLRHIAQNQQTYFWLVNVYWIQSQVSLLELDVTQAEKLLTQAQLIAEERGFNRLAKIITDEHFAFIEQVGKWENVIGQTQSIQERIEFTNLDNLVERMIDKKLYRKKEEVIEYASMASKLAEKWDID